MNENQKESIQTESNNPKKGSSMLFTGLGLVLLLGVSGFALSRKNPSAVSDQAVEGITSEEESESLSEAINENEGISDNSTPASITDNGSSVATDIKVEGGMYYFKPNVIKVKKGQPVKIVFNNAEGIHDLVIDEFNARTKQISEGKTDTVEFTPDKTGSFEFYCSVGSHRQMGMKGTLIVE